MSGIDLTLLPGGGFVAIAADVVSGRDLHAAMFDSPAGRRIKLRDRQVILRRRRGDLLLYWMARQRGDNQPDAQQAAQAEGAHDNRPDQKNGQRDRQGVEQKRHVH